MQGLQRFLTLHVVSYPAEERGTWGPHWKTTHTTAVRAQRSRAPRSSCFASTPAERVLAVRHDFQMVMREELVAMVERTLDRKVVAFMSDNHLDPDLAVEVFILEPTTSEPVG